jgi:hypothetical protein
MLYFRMIYKLKHQLPDWARQFLYLTQTVTSIKHKVSFKYRKLLLQDRVCVGVSRTGEGYKEVLCACHSVTLMQRHHGKRYKEHANSTQTFVFTVLYVHHYC